MLHGLYWTRVWQKRLLQIHCDTVLLTNYPLDTIIWEIFKVKNFCGYPYPTKIKKKKI